MMRRVLGDLIGGYLYLGAMALITLLVVPVYVRWLGPEVWGIVAWCLTLQGILFSFDALFASLMMRDVARAEVGGSIAATHRHHARRYLRGALLLFTIGQIVVLVLSGAGFVDLSADRWWALQLALVQVLFQFANLSAVGYWMGRNRPHVANARLAAFVMLKHALALWLIARFQASAAAYLMPFALIGAVEFIANRRRIRRELDAEADHPDRVLAPEQRSELAVHAFASLLAMATSHADRVLLSLALPAAEYGRYFLLSSLLLSLLHLQMPLSRSFLPRIATAPNPGAVVRRMMVIATLWLGVPAGVLALNAERILHWWLGDPVLAAAGAPSLRLLFLAGALIVISGPVAVQLVNEHRYRLQAGIQFAMFVVQLATITMLVPHLGMLSGAVAWLLAAVVQSVCFAIVLVRSPATSQGRQPDGA